MVTSYLLLLACLHFQVCFLGLLSPPGAEARSAQFVSTISQPSRQVKDQDDRLRGIRSEFSTDFVLGFLIPIHDSATNSSGGQCGDVLTDQGVQRVDTILYVLDCINSNPDLLPNLTLGYDIRDTCYSQNIALDEALDILVAESEVQLESCSSNAPGSADLRNLTDDSFLVGVIGATASGVTVPVASLLRLFSITQVSYLSTSPLLSNRDRYAYFLRTVPPDDLQAAAMYKVALNFNWTLVSIVHSNDAYGSVGAQEFRTISAENNKSVCVDLDISLDISFNDDQYIALAQRLVSQSKANVVVIFSATTVARNFFRGLQTVPGNQRFVWLGSDAIVASDTIQRDYHELLYGMFGFYPEASSYADFQSYYRTVNLTSNQRNRQWYTEKCSAYFGNQCNGDSSVTTSNLYGEDTSGTLVVDAIYTFATALDRILNENCDLPVVWNRTTQTCEGQNSTITRSQILEYVQNSNFMSPTGSRVMFDRNGNREALYSVTNLQRRDSNGFELVQVGTYNSMDNSFTLDKSIQLSLGPGVDGAYIESQCRTCKPGNIVTPVAGSCCGTCQPCLGQTIANVTSSNSNPTECAECREYLWGNNPLNGSTVCNQLGFSYLQVGDVWGAILIVFSIIGLVLVAGFSVILGLFWTKPVFKSSAREQMVLLIIGLACCFILPIFYLIQPSFGICLVQRFGLWFCFSFIFGSLLVKLVRITRIFVSRGLKRPRFIEWYYQIFFTLAVVAGQMVLAIISLIIVPPETAIEQRSNSDDSNDFPTLILICKTPNLVMVIILILYDTVLIITNTILGCLTLRYPKNFNEALHIGFSSFAILVVWIGFVPSYFATQIEFKPGVIGVAILLTGFSVLLCLFGPRVIIAIKSLNSKGDQSSSFEGGVKGLTTNYAEDTLSGMPRHSVQLTNIEQTKTNN